MEKKLQLFHLALPDRLHQYQKYIEQIINKIQSIYKSIYTKDPCSSNVIYGLCVFSFL